MRQYELSKQKDTQPLLMFVIPIVVKGTVTLRPDWIDDHKRGLVVRFNGCPISDANIESLSYDESEKAAYLEFSGTVAILAANYRSAIQQLRRTQFRIDGWIDGPVHKSALAVGHVVNWCRPGSDEGFMTLIGADR